jgi:hypothetical protein
MVGVRGFEPPTPGSQNQCANRAALHPAPCVARFETPERLSRKTYAEGNSGQRTAYREQIQRREELLTTKHTKYTKIRQRYLEIRHIE